MELDVGMRSTPRDDRRRLVGRQIVEDDVDFFGRAIRRDQRIEKAQKVGRAMARTRLPDDLPRLDVESGEERERAVAHLLEALALHAAGAAAPTRLGGPPAAELGR